MERIKKRLVSFLSLLKPYLFRVLAVGMILIQWALGAIFIYSGVEKIGHPQDFLGTVYDFRLAGPLLGLTVTVVMPWLELVLGLALISGVFPGGALFAASVLGSLFLIVQASAIVRGLTISCGCFGPDEAHMVGMGTFVRTFLIFLAAVVAWCWHCYRAIPHDPRPRSRFDDGTPLIGLRQRPGKEVEVGCTLSSENSEMKVLS